MIPTLSQVCSLSSPFEDDIIDYAAGKCQSIEIWLTKLETYLQSRSLDDARRLFEENGVTVPAASFQGGLLTSQGEKRRQSWELFRRRLETCRKLDINTIVVAGDIAAPLEQSDLDRAIASMTELAQVAGAAGMQAAFEFQGSAAFANNLRTAASLVADVGSPHLGLCLDVFQMEIGPSKWADLQLLSAQNLFHVQVSDLADVPREFAADGDRILPGDGNVPIDAVIRRLDEIDYRGAISVELLNPQIWRVPARQFGEIGTTAIRRYIRQAIGETS